MTSSNMYQLVFIFLATCSCLNKISAQFQEQTSLVDICSSQNIYIPIEGGQGIVGISSSTSYEHNPCVLRIEACASCYISIELTGNNFELDVCSIDALSHSITNCTKGCEYLYLFDGYYLKDTLKYFNNNSYPHNPKFDSLSSVVYIAFCNNGKPRDIQLKYITKSKYHYIDSAQAEKGTIRSLNFPLGYVQNGEQVIYYFINSQSEKKYIFILFDDWDLSSSSEIYFDNSNFPRPIQGDSLRPAVKSEGSKMRVVFNLGRDLIGGGGRRHMGFKFSYTFYNADEYAPAPLTNCGEYLMRSEGGTIDQSFRNLVSIKLHDCIWVIKKQQGYDNVLLNLITFRSENTAPYTVKPNQLEIREGLTSDGRLLKKIYPNMTTTMPFTFPSSTGFYIRLRGQFRSMDKLVLSYTSFTYGNSGCSQFSCGNLRCIPSKLVCDNVDHCGDRSDETIGCMHDSTGWSTASSRYNLTISVIIPMVISILLLIILCVLFFLIRRCRKAREQEMARMRDIPSVSGQMPRGRRRRNQRPYERPAQYPPTYEEALNSPPFEEPAMESWEIGPDGLPKPPSYDVAIGANLGVQIPHQTLNPADVGGVSPSSTNSTETDRSTNIGNRTISSTDSSGTEDRRPNNHTYSMSYSSDSSVDISPTVQRNVPLLPPQEQYQSQNNTQTQNTTSHDSNIKPHDVHLTNENLPSVRESEYKQQNSHTPEETPRTATEQPKEVTGNHISTGIPNRNSIGKNFDALDSNRAKQDVCPPSNQDHNKNSKGTDRGLSNRGQREGSAGISRSLLLRLADIETRLKRDPHSTSHARRHIQGSKKGSSQKEPESGTPFQDYHQKERSQGYDGDLYKPKVQEPRRQSNSNQMEDRESPEQYEGRRPSGKYPVSRESQVNREQKKRDYSDPQRGRERTPKFGIRPEESSRSSSSELLFSDRHFASESRSHGHHNLAFRDSQEFSPVSSSTPRLSGTGATSLGNLNDPDHFNKNNPPREKSKSLQNLPRAECKTFTIPNSNSESDVCNPVTRSLNNLDQREPNIAVLPRSSVMNAYRQHRSESDVRSNALVHRGHLSLQDSTIDEDVFV